MEESAIFHPPRDTPDRQQTAQRLVRPRVPPIEEFAIGCGSRLATSDGMITLTREKGSSLVEALVAAVIMSTGVVTMVQLLAMATATNQAARSGTLATIVAEQKLEELRTLPWADLQPAPSSTLQQDTNGYFDQVGMYTRRWSVELVSPNLDDARLLQVLVVGPPGSSALSVSSNRLRGAARIATVRARRTQ